MTWEEASDIIDKRQERLNQRRFIVYKITCTKTGLSYIGVTAADLLVRWERHIAASKRNNRPINAAIVEHGRDSFELSVIEKIRGRGNAYLASRVEKYWIYKLNTVHPHGYNKQNVSGRVFKEYIKYRETIERKRNKNN